MQWTDLIGDEKNKPYFRQLMDTIKLERSSGKIVFPPHQDVFNAFRYTALDKLKVVILGQDPYHGPNQAHGLCFSVRKGNSIPPSLRNIYQELQNDIVGFEPPNHGELTHWAEQGVLLLNTVLTVRQGEANSHRNIGWELFTDAVISTISERLREVIFILWGAPAQKKAAMIDQESHFLLKSPHPSPLSAHRGFFGCGHFSKTNKILEKLDLPQINWHLPK